jgi:sorbitol-specific phosphotransferase system component IIC
MNQEAERVAQWLMLLGLVPMLLALLLPMASLASFVNAAQNISVSAVANRLASPALNTTPEATSPT